jgi:hypothetical protein
MLILHTALTKKTTSLYITPTPKALEGARALHFFLTNIQVTQLEEGFSFHIEAAKDNENNVYHDIYMVVNSQFTLNGEKYLSNGGLAVNIQPLINFLGKVLQTNNKD